MSYWRTTVEPPSFTAEACTHPGKKSQRETSSSGLWHSWLEHVYGSDNVLAADGTFAHALATLGASDHVATFQQHAIYDGIHADPAEVVVLIIQLSLLSFCQGTTEPRLDRLKPQWTCTIPSSHIMHDWLLVWLAVGDLESASKCLPHPNKQKLFKTATSIQKSLQHT